METNNELMKTVTEKANLWLSDAYDEETRTEVKRMLETRTQQNSSTPSIRILNSAQAVSAASWAQDQTA